MLEIFQYANNWEDARITHNVTCMYTRKAYVKSATRLFTEALNSELAADPNSPSYVILTSSNSQVRMGTRAEYSNATERSRTLLNNKLREPDMLVLVEWGVYECTINDPNGRNYNQSTLTIVVDVPSLQDINAFRSFNVWVAPPGTQYVTFLHDGSEKPSKDDLRIMGWKEVKIGVAPERPMRICDGCQALC